MSLRIAFVVGLAVSGVVLACSGSGTVGGASAGDTQSFLGEFCGLYAPCCSKVGKPTDGASCRAGFSAQVGDQPYNVAKGNACLAEIRAQSNAPDYCDDPTAKAPSCKGAFGGGGGTKQPGEECSKDGDCASSPEGSVNCASSYSGSAETRSCQVELDGKAGSTPCISTRDGNTSIVESSFSPDGGTPRPPARGYICDVANGIYCNGTTAACTKIENVGGPCNGSDTGCVKTAFCDYSVRQCVARRAVGEDCKANSQACVAKSSCDEATKKCVAALSDGAACTGSGQCASRRCVNQKCQSQSNEVAAKLCGG